MSGWFPMDLDLQDKPEFLCIQATLDIDPDLLVGKLWKFWAWFDEQTTDGVMPRVSAKIVDARIGVKGFAEAMVEAGWLLIDESGVRIPGFEKRHSNSAKQRLLHARRQANYKKRGTSKQSDDATPSPERHPSVSDPSPEQHQDGNKSAPTKPNQTKHTSTASKDSVSNAQAKAAVAAESRKFVEGLSEDWKPAIRAVRSTKAKVANWAIQVAVEAGYSPQLVIDVVQFAKKHKRRFQNAPGAVIDRLTTVGPEVPANEQWPAEIPPEAKPRAPDPEKEFRDLVAAIKAREGCTPSEAAELAEAEIAKRAKGDAA